jgi:serine/threonine protein kinase
MEDVLNEISHLFPVQNKKRNVSLIRIIASSSHTKVWLGYDNQFKTLVVLKEVHHDAQNQVRASVKREIRAHGWILEKGLQRKNFLQQLVHIEVNQYYVRFISVYIPCSFDSIFTETTFAPCPFFELKCYQLIKTVRNLHHDGLSHRDIKPSNIGFDQDGNLILFDFDLMSNTQFDTTIPMTTFCYRAPELVQLEISYLKHHGVTDYQNGMEENKVGYNCMAIDWWSVGCVMMEMLSGEKKSIVGDFQMVNMLADLEHLSQNIAVLIESVKNHEFEKYNVYPSVELQSILTGLLHPSADNRIQTGNHCILRN